AEAALTTAAAGRPAPGFGMHAFGRRVADWEADRLGGQVLKAAHGREWLTLVSHWRSRPDADVSFIADPRRTDLALFDPAARLLERAYRWAFSEPPFVGGARLGADGRGRRRHRARAAGAASSAEHRVAAVATRRHDADDWRPPRRPWRRSDAGHGGA